MTASADVALRLPAHRNAYYGGDWHEPASGAFAETLNPSTGESLGRVAVGGATDVDAAVAAAKRGFLEWRAVVPLAGGELARLGRAVERHAVDLEQGRAAR